MSEKKPKFKKGDWIINKITGRISQVIAVDSREKDSALIEVTKNSRTYAIDRFHEIAPQMYTKLAQLL